MLDKKVRVRFAPSPTGPLHIGGVRTALFNYLFARKHNGTFILRIEDTDQTRFVEGAEEYITESLNWLGLKIDEGGQKGGEYGPYKQSERKEIYRKYSRELVNAGWAYYAFDTPEQLDELRAKYESEKRTFAYDISNRAQLSNSLSLTQQEVKEKLDKGEPYVIRFKMPENVQVGTSDLIRGNVSFNANTLDDKVLYKSTEDLPTYHLANIVDDHLMKITHVIRGEEWLPSLPLHVMLYKAFGWEESMPEFAHLPLILKPNGKGKLSKRDGDKEGFPVFPLEWKAPDGEISAGYRESGYFPEAVVNLLALLGWNPGTEQELFTMDELINVFSLERVNKSGARFDPDKAKWFNHQYLMNASIDEILPEYRSLLMEKGIDNPNDVILKQIIGLVKERANFVSELWDQSSFFFVAPEEYDPKVVNKRWKPGVPEFLSEVGNLFDGISVWKADEIKETVSELIQAREQNFGVIMNSLRLAMVGGSFGPDLFTIIEILGKEEVKSRINKAILNIKQ